MTKLNKQDWERARAEAIDLIKQSEIMFINGTFLLTKADEMLKTFKNDKS